MIEVVAFCFVLLALTAFVAAPLYAPRSARQDPGSAADGASERLRQAIDELDVDRASGLLDEGAYRAERSALETRVAGESSERED